MKQFDRRQALKLAGVATLTTVPAPSSGDTRGDYDKNVETQATFNLSNEHLTLPMSSSGKIQLETAEGKPLLYPLNFTSRLSIRVGGEGGTTYTNDEAGEDMSPYLTSESPEKLGPKESRTEWNLPEVTVERNIVLNGESAGISLTVSNSDSEPHTVDIRYLLDYQVDVQDGAPIFVNGEVYITEKKFDNPTFETYQTYDQIPEPELVGVGSSGAQLDRQDLVYWPDASDTVYNYTPDPNKQFYTPGENSFPESDSAGLLYWELGQLVSGEEQTVATNYGVGEPEDGDSIDELESAVQEFKQSMTSLLSTNVQLRAKAHAELYAEVGEEYADNLINYFAYEAGIIDSPDSIDDELFEPLQAQTEGLYTPNAGTLYNFFNEMFAAASPDEPIDSIEGTFEAYFRGTADGQSHKLLVNGQTIDELESNFVEDFEEITGSSLTELQNDPPEESTISSLIAIVEEKADIVSKRENELSTEIPEVIDASKNGEEVVTFGAQIQAAPTSAGSRSEVGTQVGFTLSVISVGMFVKLGGGTLIATGGLYTLSSAPTVTAGVYNSVSGAIAYLQQSAVHWQLMSTWQSLAQPVSSVSAKGVAKSLISGELLEVLGLSPEEIIEDYTGIEISVISGVEDAVALPIEVALEQAAEGYDNFGQSLDVIEVDADPVDAGDIENQSVEGTATVTVENQSNTPTIPRINPEQTAIRTAPVIGDLISSVPVSGTYVVPDEEIPEIPPGSQETIDLRFGMPTENNGPLGDFLGLYKLRVSMYPLYGGSTDSAIDNFQFVGLDLPDLDVNTLLSGQIGSGGVDSGTTSVQQGTDRAAFDMSYGVGNLDLHLYDDQNNHVGRNYQTGEYEVEIPGATTAGPDSSGDSNESIILDQPSGQYETEVVAVETGGDETTYSTDEAITPDLDPMVNVLPGVVDIYIRADIANTGDRTLIIKERTDTGQLTDVTVTPSTLTADTTADTIPASNIEISENDFQVSPGGEKQLTLSLSIPDDIAVGTYTGPLTVTSEEDTTENLLRVSIVNELLPLPGFDNPPKDIDDDGLYEDVDGDGEFDIFDVQALFDGLDSVPVQNNPAAFNFNDDDNPDEVTIFDVQGLFELLD
jgi:hypothetical protein